MAIVRMRDGVHLDVIEAMLRKREYTRAEVLGRTTLDLRLWARPRSGRDWWRCFIAMVACATSR